MTVEELIMKLIRCDLSSEVRMQIEDEGGAFQDEVKEVTEFPETGSPGTVWLQ